MAGTRRRWLAQAAALACAPLCGGAAQAAVEGADDEASAWRVLNRVSWGADADGLRQCRELGISRWLQRQLAMAPATLPAAVQAQVDGLSISTRPLKERVDELRALRLEANTPGAGEDARRRLRQALALAASDSASRLLLRALHAPSQLHERVSWAWFNHFNLHRRKQAVALLLADYEDHAIRPHALGSFRAMLGAVTRHPAMLQYLDNARNAAGRPNENHARELLELHTLGVAGGYTQQDVQALARVLTGHGLRESGYAFIAARHDFGDKQLLGRTIRGRGAAELDEALDLLAGHPATARQVARRLSRSLFSESPPEALVERMAQAFDGDRIAPCLQVLLQSPEFLTAEPAQFKDPMLFVLSSVRLLQGGQPLLDTLPLQRALAQLGEAPHDHAAPDGYPLQAAAWNGSGQLAARFDVARALAARYGVAVDIDTPPWSPLPLREATQRALAAAGSPRERVALLLSSPDFMVF
jgi:uncharacterized protein (DUF1800 family)